jgi:hypothetical protein
MCARSVVEAHIESLPRAGRLLIISNYRSSANLAKTPPSGEPESTWYAFCLRKLTSLPVFHFALNLNAMRPTQQNTPLVLGDKIFHLIMSGLDQKSLSVVCRTTKLFHKYAVGILWRSIDGMFPFDEIVS